MDLFLIEEERGGAKSDAERSSEASNRCAGVVAGLGVPVLIERRQSLPRFSACERETLACERGEQKKSAIERLELQ